MAKEMQLSRRSFLKTGAAGAAGLAAMGTLASCKPADKPAETPDEPVFVEETKVFQSCMGNCSGWGCPSYVTVREGKVANIERAKLKVPDGTDSPYQETCMKGYANIERMYAPDRLLYPMKRVAGSTRGTESFERISWDQAVTEITDKWKALQAQYGPESVAFFSGSGSGMATISYTGRLQALMGAMSILPCYDNTGMLTQIAHGGYGIYTIGHNEHRDMLNCDNLFIWGTNPTESNVVDFHMVSETREKGAKVICIDPIYTTSAAKADIYVPIRPATDGLLACAMAQISIRDGFENAAHLKALTNASFLVKESDGLCLRLSDLGQAEPFSAEDAVLAMSNGELVPALTCVDGEIRGSFNVKGIAVKPAYQILLDRLYAWDLETISQITDVPMATIEELAKIWNSGNSFVLTGFGPDHYSNGQCTYDGIMALMDITGMEAGHGRGMSCTDFSAPNTPGLNNQATTDLVGIAAAGGSISAPHFHQLMADGTLAGITAPKSCYIYICNPITNEPDRQAWLRSLAKMEMIVVADMRMSETCLYADYLLPVAFLYERTDLSASSNPYIKLTEQAVEPAGESLSDFDIITKLGIGMGFGQYFQEDMISFLKRCVNNDASAAVGVSWDKLKEEHAIWTYPLEPSVCGLNDYIFTGSGRFEFYHEGIQPQHNVGQAWDMKKESCWFWEPPLDSWTETMGGFEANPKAAEHPFICISERCKFKTHTMFNDCPMILEIDPEPYIKVNPVDAAAYGVTEGSIVRLSNERGYVVIRVALNAGVRPGMLVIDHGWERDSYIDGHYSDLSTSESWPRYEQDNWFDCLVKMEKVQ